MRSGPTWSLCRGGAWSRCSSATAPAARSRCVIACQHYQYCEVYSSEVCTYSGSTPTYVYVLIICVLVCKAPAALSTRSTQHGTRQRGAALRDAEDSAVCVCVCVCVCVLQHGTRCLSYKVHQVGINSSLVVVTTHHSWHALQRVVLKVCGSACMVTPPWPVLPASLGQICPDALQD
jgi:hypothetical protein